MYAIRSYYETCSETALRAIEALGLAALKSDSRADPSGLAPSRAITDDIATIIYTSGSTGLPKGIVITHRNLLDGIDSVSEYLGITEKDRLLGVLPLNFDYGLNQLTSAVKAGASIVLHHFFVPGPMLKLIAEERITGLAAIPTIWAAVFNPKLTKLDKILAEMDFSSLRYITNSGGKIPVPTVRRIRECFPSTDLFLMYGLTEAFRSTYLDPSEVDARPESMGKAIPGVQVEIVREDGTPCAAGETGELIHRGALIARGYWNNPSKTAEVYRPNPLLPKENRFLETAVYSGDLVRKDEDGFVITSYSIHYTKLYEVGDGGSFTVPACAYTLLNSSFAYWNTKADGSGQRYDSGDIISAISSDITLYAIWGAIRTVSFDSNDGTGTMTPVLIGDGGSFTVPACAFTRTGFNFVEWNTHSDGDGESYAAGDQISPVSGDITLYAVWNIRHRISFA